MAMTEDRVNNNASTVDVTELERMWRAPAREVPTPRAARSRSRRTIRAMLAAWSVIFGGLLVFAPAPDNPAPIPAWEALFGIAFLAAVTTAFVGLTRARPWALRASMAAALLGVIGGIACNVVDHHSGSWWLVETGGFSALALMTVAAARRL
jgi:peptidoglycan/LPS O-acetylase OafA/YrhL